MSLESIALLGERDRQAYADLLALELSRGWPEPWRNPIQRFIDPYVPSTQVEALMWTEHVCDEPGCGLKHKARGKCVKHYKRLLYAEQRDRRSHQQRRHLRVVS